MTVRAVHLHLAVVLRAMPGVRGQSVGVGVPLSAAAMLA
jgi:hypothetical protein